MNQEQIEKIILESDLWDAFISAIATIHQKSKEDTKKEINSEFYKDIAKKIKESL